MNGADAINTAKQLIRAREYAKAEALLTSLIKSSPADAALAWQELGNVYYLQDRFQAAVDCFRHRLHIEFDSATAHYSMALTLVRLKHDDEARYHLQQTLRINPDYPRAKELARTLAPVISTPIKGATPESIPPPEPAPTGIGTSAGPDALDRTLSFEARPRASRYVILDLASLVAAYFVGLWLAIGLKSPVPLLIALLVTLAAIIYAERKRRTTLFQWFNDSVTVRKGSSSTTTRYNDIQTLRCERTAADRLFGTVRMDVELRSDKEQVEQFSMRGIAWSREMDELCTALQGKLAATDGIQSSWDDPPAGFASRSRYRLSWVPRFSESALSALR